VFDSDRDFGGNLAGATTETRWCIRLRRWCDYAFTQSTYRYGEYRGYVYNCTDFNIAGLNTDRWAAYAQRQPDIVLRFNAAAPKEWYGVQQQPVPHFRQERPASPISLPEDRLPFVR